ncbi:MAG: M23 family metallopeptidase [Pseudomonadota bacterium]
MLNAFLALSLTVVATETGTVDPPFTTEGLEQPFERGQPGLLWLTARAPVARVEGELLGRPTLWVPWSRGRVLGLIAVAVDDTLGSQVLRLRYASAAGETREVEIPVQVIERDYPSDTLRVAPRYTKLSARDKKRVARERRRLDAMWQQRSQERLWRGSFVRPIDTKVTSVFGERRVFNGKQRSRHLGLDLDGNGGESIVAANRGRVALAEALFYSGNSVILDHGQGLYTLYFHMQQIDVKEGDLVDKGQRLGTVGKTGRVTGPHLHLSVKLAGVYLDPSAVLALDLEGDPLQVPASSAPAP